MAFGERLQEVRRKNGLTQEQFAEQLQVSRQAVSKWESGRGYPEMEKLLYICSRYQVTLNELFEQEVSVQQEKVEQPQKVSAQPLGRSVAAFVNNLAPRNKWLGIGTLVGVALLAVLIGTFLKNGGSDMTTIIWIAAIVIFGVMEALTAGLMSIWFVAGSVAGLVVAAANGSIWMQLLAFFVVSILALLVTRPLVKKLMGRGVVATNADRVLGETARVVEQIDNTIPTGAVYIDGKTWSARSNTGAVIAEGTLVRVVEMQGVKLMVEEV